MSGLDCLEEGVQIREGREEMVDFVGDVLVAKTLELSVYVRCLLFL